MTRMPFGIALALAATLALAGQQAAAQTKPFKISGAGVPPTGFPLPGEAPRFHPIEGTATHLGHHTGGGYVKTDWAEPIPELGIIVGEFGGASPYVFTGADGDQLATYYGRPAFGAAATGTFVLTIVDVLANGSLVVEAAWVAEFVAQPGLSTGKFAGVTGSWMMYAFSEPFVLGSSDPISYWWSGEGELTFAKP